MSVENINNFLELCSSNEERRKEMQTQANFTPERLVELAKAAGYECSVEDWRDWGHAGQGMLSDNDLDAVSGGRRMQKTKFRVAIGDTLAKDTNGFRVIVNDKAYTIIWE